MPKQIAKIGFFEFPKFLPGTGFSAIESAIESAMESAIQCKFYRLTRPSGQYGPIIGRNGPKSNVCKNRFLEFRIFWGVLGLGRPFRDLPREVWQYDTMATLLVCYSSFNGYQSTGVQKNFPINELAWINYRKWVISKSKIGNNWEQFGIRLFWGNFPKFPIDISLVNPTFLERRVWY